jgi:hypothetical protein
MATGREGRPNNANLKWKSVWRNVGAPNSPRSAGKPRGARLTRKLGQRNPISRHPKQYLNRISGKKSGPKNKVKKKSRCSWRCRTKPNQRGYEKEPRRDALPPRPADQREGKRAIDREMERQREDGAGYLSYAGERASPVPSAAGRTRRERGDGGFAGERRAEEEATAFPFALSLAPLFFIF